ncbi:MAG: hypothetical protein ACOCP8_04920 [archaeon]
MTSNISNNYDIQYYQWGIIPDEYKNNYKDKCIIKHLELLNNSHEEWVKNQSTWYIAIHLKTNIDSFGYNCDIYLLDEITDYLKISKEVYMRKITKLHGFIKNGKICFNSKKYAKKAKEWIESILISNKLSF